MRKSSRLLLPASAFFVLFIIAVGSVYTWRTLLRTCDVHDVERASAFLARQRDSFDHSYQFATSATPDSIVRPVAELQQILMDTLAYPVPICMRTAKNELISYMGAVVRAFLAYGAQESDLAFRNWLDQSTEHYENFAMELKRINECAPFCLRP